MDDFGRLLLDERARRLWPQEKVADACGISRQQLSRYETGAATPTWEVFRRILAAYGLQPRIALEPLNADVIAAIARQRKRPRAEWLSDVGFAASSLHKLLDGLTWQATGPLALRLLGAPVPLTELAVEVALDEAGWERLFENAWQNGLRVRNPDDRDDSSPFDPHDLRWMCAVGEGTLRWPAIGAMLALRVVEELGGGAVQVEADEWTWWVASVDQLDFDDPWMARLLDQIRRERELEGAGAKSDDSVEPVA